MTKQEFENLKVGDLIYKPADLRSLSLDDDTTFSETCEVTKIEYINSNMDRIVWFKHKYGFKVKFSRLPFTLDSHNFHDYYITKAEAVKVFKTTVATQLKTAKVRASHYQSIMTNIKQQEAVDRKNEKIRLKHIKENVNQE